VAELYSISMIKILFFFWKYLKKKQQQTNKKKTIGSSFRNCIGQVFAMNEIKIAISKLVNR
jgi:hypothetical protein